jgi:predicted RNA-binding Zn-ribbon protein involved in translation (DUF1610 family)
MAEHVSINTKLPVANCPKCGRAMESGFIASKQTRLRWVQSKKTQTIFAGEQLTIQFNLWSAPTYEAYRCDECGLALLNYDPKTRDD